MTLHVQWSGFAVCCSVLQCVAVCCSVLQCVVACCSVLPLYILSRFVRESHVRGSALQRVAACCGVLRRVASVYSF